MADDATLLERYAVSRDAEAFAELMRRYAGLVYGTCLRVLGNRTQSEDVTQECFFELADRSDRIRGSLPAWLHCVAVRRSRNCVRGQTRRERRERVAAAVRASESAGDRPTWHDVAPHMDAALETLPKELRDVLIRHFIQGKTQPEIADSLGVNQSTVSRRLQRGVELLRKKLRKAGVVASVVAITTLLSANAVHAAPTTLVAALGKMAMAGVGGSISAGAGAGGVAGGSAVQGGIGIVKLSLIGLAAATVVAVAAVGLNSGARPPTAGTTAPRATPAPKPVPAVMLPDKGGKAPEAALYHEYVIMGIVLDPEGNPVTGAIVSYGSSIHWQHYRATTTDNEGAFWLGRIAESRPEVVFVQAMGYAPAYQWTTPGMGTTIPKLSFQLLQGHEASGQVLDREGRPIQGARITYSMAIFKYGRRRDLGTVRTDAEGRFRLDSLPADGVQVTVSRNGFSTASNVSLPAGRDTVVRLDPIGRIVVKVVDGESGKPLPSFSIRLNCSKEPRRHDEPLPRLGRDDAVSGQGFSAEDGIATVTPLIARASYAVIVGAAGYAETRVDPVVARPRGVQEKPLLIKLQRGILLTGEAINKETGKPVEGAEVFLMQNLPWPDGKLMIERLRESDRGLDWLRSSQTDDNGRFDLGIIGDDNLPVVLAVQHKDYATLLMKDVDPAWPVAIPLAQGGTIIVKAKDVNGFAPFAWAAEFTTANLRQSDEFGHDGVLRFDNIPADEECTVNLMQGTEGGAFPVRKTATVRVGKGKTVEVDFSTLPDVKVGGSAAKATRGESVQSSIGTKIQEPVERKLQIRLPFPELSFVFLNPADLLSGKLTLRIVRDGDATEINIFEKGKFAEGWEPIPTPRAAKTGMYCGFISTHTYPTAPRDTIELELIVEKDLEGIGPRVMGFLPAGTYRCKGSYSLLTDVYDTAPILQRLEESGKEITPELMQNLEKLSDKFSHRAFLETWENKLPLQVTSEEGWLKANRETAPK